MRSICRRLAQFMTYKKLFGYIDDSETILYGYNVPFHLKLLDRKPFDVYLMSDVKEIRELLLPAV